MTVPPPVPDFATVRLNVFSVKVAVTDLALLIATVHVVPLVLSQPDQFVKSESVADVAVRVTEVLTL